MKRIYLVLVSLLLSQANHAALITVDSLLDNTDVDGSCTFREAVAAASDGASDDCTAGEISQDTIVFAEGVTGTLGFSQAAELNLSGSVAIEGPGSQSLIIDGLRLARILHVTQAAGETLSISGITIRNGNTPTDDGGLLIDGATAAVTLDDVVFDGNFAGGAGGGMALLGPDSTTVSISGSAFTGNEADTEAAALFVTPTVAGLSLTMNVVRSRFQDNISLIDVPNVVAKCDSAPCDFLIESVRSADNEGIHMDLQAQAPDGDNKLIVRKSLFLGEDAAGYSSEHGGLMLATNQGELKVYNNSFSQNKAMDFGALSISTGDVTWPALVAFNSFAFNVDRTQFFTRTLKASAAEVRIYANLLQDGQCIVDETEGGSITSLGWNYVTEGDSAVCASSNEDEIADGVWFVRHPAAFGDDPEALLPWAGVASIDAIPDCQLPALGIGDQTELLTEDQSGNTRPTHSFRANRCDAGSLEAGPTLSIFETGTGGGSLGIDPVGFVGFSAASDRDGGGYFQSGTLVMLTPFPNSDSVFTGYFGDCTGVGECAVLVDMPRTIDADFQLEGDIARLDVMLSGTGTGTITSNPAGIDCPGTCSAFFDANSNVTLTFSTGAGSDFAGWSGDCFGVGVCQLTMDSDKSATADFDNPDVFFQDDWEWLIGTR